MRIVRKAAWILAAVVCITAHRVPAAQLYTLTDLGALAGTTMSTGHALNNLGQAAGLSNEGVLFSNGTVTLAGTLQSAQGINDSTEIAGWAFSSSDVFEAFTYSNGEMTNIGSATFPSGSASYGINNSGQVVGYGVVRDNYHAFLYSEGKMTDLSVLAGPGHNGMAYAINNSGEVVAEMGFPYLYSNGKFTNLGVPAGFSSSSADAINDAGQIVGSLETSSGTYDAALYSNGEWTSLGMIAGTVTDNATGINDSGQIVGWASFPKKLGNKAPPPIVIGFIYSNGTLVDLDTLIPANSGYTITSAVAINTAGQILCDATGPKGAFTHAVLLTP
jgi:probable HAF family extracellular repeat protein